MRSDDKYAAMVTPSPLTPITENWQKEYLSKKEGLKQRDISMKIGHEDSSKKKNFFAMYCPECREWNGEPGEYPGYCISCEAELKVVK